MAAHPRTGVVFAWGPARAALLFPTAPALAVVAEPVPLRDVLLRQRRVAAIEVVGGRTTVAAEQHVTTEFAHRAELVVVPAIPMQLPRSVLYKRVRLVSYAVGRLIWVQLVLEAITSRFILEIDKRNRQVEVKWARTCSIVTSTSCVRPIPSTSRSKRG